MPASPSRKSIHVDINVCFLSPEQGAIPLPDAVGTGGHREDSASDLAMKGRI
jgi:hypothetical protein